MQLSSSALGTFLECQHCFYQDRVLKKPRPQGIKSGMPNAVDSILKSQMDVYRGKNLPADLNFPELEGFQLFNNQEKLKQYRQWNSKGALKYIDAKGNILVTALDDLLFNPSNGLYAMMDYKSTGKVPTQEFAEKYYQKQVDLYTWTLRHNMMPTVDFGILYFFWPECVGGALVFKSKAFIVKSSDERALALFDEAIKCLEGKEIPASNPECEYCSFVQQRSK